MDWPPIFKSLTNLPVQPNLVDYDKARADFSWEAIRKELSGLPNGGLNIAHEAVDRHAGGPRRDHLALRWLGADGATRDFSYRDLAEGSNRFANMVSGKHAPRDRCRDGAIEPRYPALLPPDTD